MIHLKMTGSDKLHIVEFQYASSFFLYTDPKIQYSKQNKQANKNWREKKPHAHKNQNQKKKIWTWIIIQGLVRGWVGFFFFKGVERTSTVDNTDIIILYRFD